MFRKLSFSATCLVVGLAAITHATPAKACSPVRNVGYTFDPAMVEVDSTPPSAPVISNLEVSIAADAWPFDDNCGSTSYNSYDVAATDDLTAHDDLGFAEVPAGSDIDAQLKSMYGASVQQALSGRMYRAWVGNEGIDEMVDVYAFDRAGNHSEPTTIHIYGEPGGCSMGGRGGDPNWLLLALAALAVGIRRCKEGKLRERVLARRRKGVKRANWE